MTLTVIPHCPSCRHSYDGADAILRCRIHSNGLKCSPAAAEDCRTFEREPGADDSRLVWLVDAWVCA